MESPILIICIDRDNDLYEKAKVRGPVIGREANIAAATQLAVADPEDADSNAMFYAVKIYDQVKKENNNTEVVTLTGHRKLGYTADRQISRQIEKVIKETNASSCILISDGSSDEEVLPLIKSRLKIESTKIVIIKQAKELEKTYFVLLEKLKDPHYSKIVLGIPAFLMLFFSISSFYGLGWQPVGIVLGIYLLLKGFGIEETAIGLLKDFSFSIERTSWIGYVAGLSLFLISIFIAYQTYMDLNSNIFIGGEKVAAGVIRNTVVVMLISALLVISGKAIDALAEKRKFQITKYSLYAVSAILLAMVLRVGSSWVTNTSSPYVSFGDFLLVLISSLVIGYFSTRIITGIRSDIFTNMKIEGKEVINEYGMYLGKVIGVNGKESMLVVQTGLEKKYRVPFNAVTHIEDSVIVKA